MRFFYNFIFFSIFGCIIISFLSLAGNYAFGQEPKPLRIEKRLSKLYYIKENEKKCNRVGKQFLKRNHFESDGIDSALFFVTLTYLEHFHWPYKANGHIRKGKLKEQNYIDSAFKYNDLFLESSGSSLNEKGEWHKKIFPYLIMNLGFLAQNDSRDNYKDLQGQALYHNNKNEYDSIFEKFKQLHDQANSYFKEYKAYILTKLLLFREDLGILATDKELDDLYEEIIEFNNLYRSQVFYKEDKQKFIELGEGEIIRYLLRNDISKLYKFFRAYETSSIKLRWDIERDFQYFNERMKIFKIQTTKIDAGTFYITDSLRNNEGKIEYKMEIPFSYDIYAGDTMSLIKSHLKWKPAGEDVVIENLSLFQNLVGTGNGVIQLNFIYPKAYLFNPNLEWSKYSRYIVITSNRGAEEIDFTYRLKYEK